MKAIGLFASAIFFVSVFASCKKEDKPVEKTVMFKKRTHTQGADSWAVEYTFDANGVATQYKATGTNSNFTITFQRNAAGKISRFDYSNGATGYAIVTYDASGRVQKMESFNTSDASLGYIVYSYASGYHEIRSYSSNGTYTGKNMFYYTANGKNVATQKIYNASGVQTSERTFTFSDKRSATNIYPEIEMQQLSVGYANENATLSETVSNLVTSSNNYTKTTSNSFNTEDYLIQSQSTFTNAFSPLLSSYEYVSR